MQKGQGKRNRQAARTGSGRAGKRVMYGIDLVWFIPSIPNKPTGQPNVDH